MKFKQIVCSVALVFSFGVSAFTIKDMQNPTKREITQLEKEAKKGDPEALATLTSLYVNGWGVKEDIVKALELAKKAANQGHEMSQIQIADLYLQGLEHTTEELIKALLWLNLHARNNIVEAQVLLGRYYLKGLGIEQDFTKAADWLEKAADQGDSLALKLIISMHQSDSEVIEKDYFKMIKWLNQLALENDEDALLTLGRFYEEGLGVRQDEEKAIEWYEKSIEVGSVIGMQAVARIHISKKNYSKAKVFLELGAQQDDAISQYILAQFYESGAGVRQDLTEAKEWYGKSCDNGSQEGCDEYKRLNR